jgi:hypothetical protein
MITNAQRLAARIREVRAAIERRERLHADGPEYPTDVTLHSAEFSYLARRYDAYAMGVLGQLADLAAQELERANPVQVAA